MNQFEKIDVPAGTLAGSTGYLGHSIALRIKGNDGEPLEVIFTAATASHLAVAIDTLMPEVTLTSPSVKTAMLAPKAIEPTDAEVDPDDDEL